MVLSRWDRPPCRSALLAAFFSVVVACKPSVPAPVEPVYGKQPCAHCAMLVSDPRYAAQAINARGDHEFFDDIGCLVLRAGVDPAKAWVHSLDGKDWLPARTARYVRANGTPMDFGFGATSSSPPDAIGYDAMAAAVRARGERRDDGHQR